MGAITNQLCALIKKILPFANMFFLMFNKRFVETVACYLIIPLFSVIVTIEFCLLSIELCSFPLVCFVCFVFF